MTFGLMLDSRGVKCQAAHDGIIIAPPQAVQLWLAAEWRACQNDWQRPGGL